MKNLKFRVLFAAASLSVSVASAVPLIPGSASPMVLEAEPIGATLVASTNVTFNGVDFFGNIKFTGNLLSQVWSGDTSNPFGGLTFTYLLSNNASSPDAMGRLTLSSFSGHLTDVSFNGPGVVPLNTVRSSGGDQIDFNLLSPLNFAHNLVPGASTPTLILQTDSLVYNIGNASIINSGVANAVALVPTTVVPEPTSLALAGLGLLALALRRKSQA